MIMEGVFIAVIMIVVGRILKPVRPPMSQHEKDRRIRVDGQLRRVCPRHQSYLLPGVMAVVDAENCQYCKMVKEIEDEYGHRL
jgi:hypothetical protein